MTRAQFRFFHPNRVRYSEIDAQGVVFNAHYLTYFDLAIHEFFRALDHLQYANTKSTGCDFHVVKALVEFKSPLLFDEEIEVGVRVPRIGRSSIVFGLGVFASDRDVAVAEGEVVWVYADQTTRRSVALRDETRRAILAYEAGHAPRTSHQST
jgi:acyl-CoA thioester hydrolase